MSTLKLLKRRFKPSAQVTRRVCNNGTDVTTLNDGQNNSDLHKGNTLSSVDIGLTNVQEKNDSLLDPIEKANSIKDVNCSPPTNESNFENLNNDSNILNNNESVSINFNDKIQDTNPITLNYQTINKVSTSLKNELHKLSIESNCCISPKINYSFTSFDLIGLRENGSNKSSDDIDQSISTPANLVPNDTIDSNNGSSKQSEKIIQNKVIENNHLPKSSIDVNLNVKQKIHTSTDMINLKEPKNVGAKLNNIYSYKFTSEQSGNFEKSKISNLEINESNQSSMDFDKSTTPQLGSSSSADGIILSNPIKHHKILINNSNGFSKESENIIQSKLSPVKDNESFKTDSGLTILNKCANIAKSSNNINISSEENRNIDKNNVSSSEQNKPCEHTDNINLSQSSEFYNSMVLSNSNSLGKTYKVDGKSDLKYSLVLEKRLLKRKFRLNKNLDGEMDKKNMTLRDYIIYNPPNNPMSDQSSLIINSSDPSDDDNDEMNEIVPQLKVDGLGNTVVDQGSLISKSNALKKTIMFEDENTRTIKRRKRKKHEDTMGMLLNGERKKIVRKLWTTEDILKFYHVLDDFGCDFSVLMKAFPELTRPQLKSKFFQEEKIREKYIDMAMKKSGLINFKELENDIVSSQRKKKKTNSLVEEVKESRCAVKAKLEELKMNPTNQNNFFGVFKKRKVNPKIIKMKKQIGRMKIEYLDENMLGNKVEDNKKKRRKTLKNNVINYDAVFDLTIPSYNELFKKVEDSYVRDIYTEEDLKTFLQLSKEVCPKLGADWNSWVEKKVVDQLLEKDDCEAKSAAFKIKNKFSKLKT